jgi:ornithine carbamoyltransferase
MQHLTQIADLTQQEAKELVSVATRYKEKHDLGLRYENVLGGKVVAMIFEKPSLRTKIAFEVATATLGGTPVFLSSAQILASGQQEQGRESVPDIARNLERFADLIIARVYHHEVIEEIAGTVTKPVINALCDYHHPTQALADLMAMTTHFGEMEGRVVSYVGDGNNVATSLLQICALCGISVAIATPESYAMPEAQMNLVKEYAEASGSEVRVLIDPVEAVTGASVVYSDTFISMGQEEEKARRIRDFEGYQVNSSLMQKAQGDAVFMHCLPAHRGEEVTNEVMDSQQSIVFDQAECRLHIARALLDVFLTRNGG